MPEGEIGSSYPSLFAELEVRCWKRLGNTSRLFWEVPVIRAAHSRHPPDTLSRAQYRSVGHRREYNQSPGACPIASMMSSLNTSLFHMQMNKVDTQSIGRRMLLVATIERLRLRDMLSGNTVPQVASLPYIDNSLPEAVERDALCMTTSMLCAKCREDIRRHR